MRKLLCAVVAAMPLVGVLGNPANAALVTYLDDTAWSAAVSGATTTVTIPDPGGVNGYLYFGQGTASATYDNVVFSTNSALGNGFFYNLGEGYTGYPTVLTSQGQSTGVANILITLPDPATAFSLDYGTFDGDDVTFLLSNGDSVQASTGADNYAVPNFFGVTDSTPFTSVLVTSSDHVLNLNNVVVYPSLAVPEPAAFVLLGTGLAGLGAVRRRKTT